MITPNLVFYFICFFFIIIYSITVVCNYETPSKCNAKTNKLFRDDDYFIQKWMDARMELRMSKLANNNLTSRELSKIIRFNQYVSRSGVILYNTTTGLLIPYARILKCGSEGISRNLVLIGSKMLLEQGMFKSTSKLELKTQNKFDEVFNNNNKTVRTPPPVIFTFVRDPFEHFISGFTESVYNHFLNHKPIIRGQEYNNIKINSSFVKEILHQFLNFKSTYEFGPLNGFEHMFPMSGVLFEFNVKIIGHLETFQNDWNNIIMPHYNITKKFISKLGQHPTSKTKINKDNNNNNNYNNNDIGDPNNARTSILQLMGLNIKYKKAICHLILIDYICLPTYTLPMECQFLNTTRDFYENKLNSLL